MFTLPDNSRVWVYKADRFLSDAETSLLQEKLNEFIPSWAAHGKKLYAEAYVLDNLWVIFAANEELEQASGCSIDKITRLVSELEKVCNCSLTNRLILAYKNQDQILLTPLAQIKDAGIQAHTLIYDDTVLNLGEFKSRLRPAQDTWLKRFL